MEIAPKSFGENLNEWFRALGRTWRPLLVSSLLVFVPLGVVIAGLFIATGAHEALLELLSPETLEAVSDEYVIDLLSSLVWVAVVWIVLQTLATVIVQIAGTRVLIEDLASMEPTGNGVTRFAMTKLAPGFGAGLVLALGAIMAIGIVVLAGWALISLMGTNFVSVFLVTVLTLTTIVVGLWVGLSVALYGQVIAIEDAGAMRSLIRSFSLIQGRWWITAGFLLVTGLIVSAIAQVFSIAFVPISVIGVFEPVLLAVAYGVAVVLYGPMTAAVAVAYAIWYVDLRARSESLTVEQLIY